MYAVYIEYTDDCTYYYTVLYAICDDKKVAERKRQEVQEIYPDRVVKVSEKFELNQVYFQGLPLC